MAYTSVKISANSSDYQSQMKSAAAQMKAMQQHPQPQEQRRVRALWTVSTLWLTQ